MHPALQAYTAIANELFWNVNLQEYSMSKYDFTQQQYQVNSKPKYHFYLLKMLSRQSYNLIPKNTEIFRTESSGIFWAINRRYS